MYFRLVLLATSVYRQPLDKLTNGNASHVRIYENAIQHLKWSLIVKKT